jgi:hypothetical protein
MTKEKKSRTKKFNNIEIIGEEYPDVEKEWITSERIELTFYLLLALTIGLLIGFLFGRSLC